MTADKFSPRSPLATGLDWQPSRNIEEGVGFPRKAVSASFVSTTAETITGLRPMIRKWGNGTIHSHVDITEAGSEETGEISWADFTVQPGLISYGTPACYPVNASTFQDALAFSTPGDNAYVVMPFSTGALTGIQFNPTVPSGQRILDVQVIFYAHMFSSYGFYFVQAYDADLPGTTPNKVPVGSFLPTIPGSNTPVVLSLGETNPLTALPWTQTSLANMALTSSAGTAFSITWGGGGAGLLYAAGMRVFYATENRVAITQRALISNESAETDAIYMPIYPLLDPATLAPGWSKAAGQEYTATFRHSTAYDDSGGFSLGGIDGDPLSPLPPAGSAIRQLGVLGNVGPAAAEAQLQPGWVFATDVLSPASPERAYMLDLQRSDGAWSTDSQPYINTQWFAILTGTPEYPRQIFQLDPAYPSNAAFGQLDIQLVRYLNPTQGITVRVYQSPSTLLGEQYLTAEQIMASRQVGLGTSCYAVSVKFDPALEIPGGTTCILCFEEDEAAPPLQGGWAIPRLTVSGDNGLPVGAWADVYGSSTTGNPVAREGSFEGITTGYALLNSTETSATSFGDIPFTLYAAPPSPTGFAVAVAEQTLNPASPGDCSWMAPDAIPPSIEYAAMTWTPLTTTDIPADQWGYYEIVRSTPDTDVWETIARITDQTVGFFNDYEARRGVQTSYRVHSYNTANGASAASPVWTVTCGLAGCEMLFTSNEAPWMNLAYPPVWDSGDATPDWTFPESTEVTYKKFYGRDYDVAFFPAERRGVEFTRTLLIGAAHTPSPGGADAFVPLRNLSRATLSYVCVLDSNGGRFFANLQVSAGSSKEPAGALLATVLVHEVTGTPSTPDVATVPPA